MKTCVFTTSYLDGRDAVGNLRFQRTWRFLDYYSRLKSELGFYEFHFCDNASDLELMKFFHATVVNEKGELLMRSPMRKDLTVTRYSDHLKRDGIMGYPYAWRGLYHMKYLAQSGIYDKIIFIDNDAYILSKRLAEYIKNLTSGFTAFWAPSCGFPENAIQVLCRDQFDTLANFCVGDYNTHLGLTMECVTPFTHVEKKFVGDRYGEFPTKIEQNPTMDYYCQARNDVELKFEGWA